MNLDQITGVVRAIVPAILAYIVAKGWITESGAADITAAAVAVVAAIWSVMNNTTEHKLTTAIAASDAVDVAKNIPPTAKVKLVANALKE